MPNLEKSADRSNLDGQSVRSTMRSHLISDKGILSAAKRQTAASTFELSRVLPPSHGGRAVVLYPSTGSAIKPTLIPECKEVPLALGPGMIRTEGLSPAFPSKVSHARCDH